MPVNIPFQKLLPARRRWPLLLWLPAILLLLAAFSRMPLANEHYLIPPLKVEIQTPDKKPNGQALVYPSYIELKDPQGAVKGRVGVLLVQGKTQLFLVRVNAERKLIGWAENFRLYNTEDQLVGYYFWSPIWSYVYDPKMKKIGQAQCIAYQGLCAAGVAGYLLGLF